MVWYIEGQLLMIRMSIVVLIRQVVVYNIQARDLNIMGNQVGTCQMNVKELIDINKMSDQSVPINTHLLHFVQCWRYWLNNSRQVVNEQIKLKNSRQHGSFIYCLKVEIDRHSGYLIILITNKQCSFSQPIQLNNQLVELINKQELIQKQDLQYPIVSLEYKQLELNIYGMNGVKTSKDIFHTI